jgi:hypothetical protein
MSAPVKISGRRPSTKGTARTCRSRKVRPVDSRGEAESAQYPMRCLRSSTCLELMSPMFKSRRRLEAENLFLRHQLNVALRHRPSRLRLRGSDRALVASENSIRRSGGGNRIRTCRVPPRLSVACCLCQSWADYITNISERSRYADQKSRSVSIRSAFALNNLQVQRGGPDCAGDPMQAPA